MKDLATSILLAFIILWLASGAKANIVYVDCNLPTALTSTPCGSTPGTACKSINLALQVAVAGDTIQLQAGVYTGSLNVGLSISLANITILGVAGQLSILDCGGSTYAFLVLAPNVAFVNLVIRNGISLDVNLAGAITVRLNVGPSLNIKAAVSLNNVNLLDITGGALLLNCLQSSSSSQGGSTPSNSAPGTSSSSSSSSAIVIQAELLGVAFVNIAVGPALKVVGAIQVSLKNCQFNNVGLASINASVAASPGILGSCIFVSADVLGINALVTISGCVFLGNHGSSLINVGSQVTGDTLVFTGTNSFLNNVASVALINTNINLSVVLCLDCNTVYTGNNCPTLCNVAPGLLGILSLCPVLAIL